MLFPAEKSQAVALCTLFAKNCALLITIFCALLLTDYKPSKIATGFILMQGYEDANDMTRIKQIQRYLEGDVASQPTIFRFGNSLDPKSFIVNQNQF